jgi:hypothetical protein
MKRTLRKVQLVVAILIVAWLLVGQIIVWYGSSLSPDDGVPWPGMDPVWLFVNQETPGGRQDYAVGARVYVDGHFVGCTLSGGPSLAINLWHLKTYEIKVMKPGFQPSIRNVLPCSLNDVEAGSSYKGLDITLQK